MNHNHHLKGTDHEAGHSNLASRIHRHSRSTDRTADHVPYKVPVSWAKASMVLSVALVKGVLQKADLVYRLPLLKTMLRISGLCKILRKPKSVEYTNYASYYATRPWSG